EDYRWSGYGEAVGGGRGTKLARRGLGSLLEESLGDCEAKADWRRTLRRYRLLLHEDGAERKGEFDGETARRGISEEEVRKVVDDGAALSVPEVLKRRVRYFSNGA